MSLFHLRQRFICDYKPVIVHQLKHALCSTVQEKHQNHFKQNDNIEWKFRLRKKET